MSSRKSMAVVGAAALLALAGCNLPTADAVLPTPTPFELPTLEVVPTATETATPPATETPTETAVPSPTEIQHRVIVRTDANCRTGPGTIYDVRGVLAAGASVRAIARNVDSNNVWLEVESDALPTCWMSIITLVVDFPPSELPVGLIPPTPTFTPGKIAGTVWHDLCDADGPDTQGCVEISGGQFIGNGLLDLGEPTIVGVTVLLGAGDCPSVGLTSDITGPNASGGYAFDGLKPGKYCVTVDADSDANDDILESGRWTSPEVGSSSLASRTITVGSGQTTAGVTFGWDYEDQP